MGQLQNEDWEHVDIEAFREAIIGNGVIAGLEVTQSATPAMTVLVSAGQCTIDGVVYAEASGQNLNISNGDASHDRKDIVVYDATAGNPAVVAGTPAAAPVPPDIPAGDILLGIVLVEANETTSIVNADITNDRVYSIKRWAHTSVSVNTTLNDAHHVVTVDATGGARTITLPTASGILGKVYVIKKIDSSANVVTVDGNAAETIDGATTITLPLQWSSTIMQSDGTNWVKIATDKTNNEIRDAVEAASDSNTFTDSDHAIVNDAVIQTDFDANTILTADSDNAPAPLTIGVQTLVGRITAGVIAALTPTQIRTLLNVEGGADVTGNNPPQAHSASHESGGSDIVYVGEYVMGADTYHANDTNKTQSITSLTLTKEIVLTTTPADTLRIHFGIQGAYGGYTYHGRVYRNGAAVGTLRSCADSKLTFDEDIAGWSDGDLLQLYAQAASLHDVTVDDFRILGKYELIEYKTTVSNNDP